MYPSEFDGFHGVSLALLVLAGIATAAWLAVLGWRWFATFPYLPDAGPKTTDLGTESPAIVNFLVHRWHLTRPALAATVLDLAARRLLGVEQYGERVVIRAYTERSEGQPLSAHEQQVFDYIRTRMGGRSAPVDALDLASDAEAESFWKRFSAAVAAEARRSRLARSRWTQTDRTLIGGFLAAALGLLAFAFGAAGLGRDPGSDSDFGQLEWFVAAGIAWVGVTTFIFTRRTLRETPQGLAVCSRWLGVREGLRETSAFSDAPAASVTTWEANLAYATALGIARRAAADLPFGAEDPDIAWSRATGEWREVEVSYPRRLGATEVPWKVAFNGLWQSALWGGLAFFVLPIVGQITWDVAHDFLRESPANGSDSNYRWLVAGFAAFFFLAGAVLFVRFLVGLALLVRGVADLGEPESIEGEVVKKHAGRVAIDDGSGDEVVAWVPPPGAPPIERGTRLRIRKSKRLHYVSTVEVIASRAGPA